MLYYVADNRLSGKLETAIQALDNVTKTYYRFANAEPRARTSQATSARRYDAHLVPYGVLRAGAPRLRACYDGISENVAGLIEHILALKATLKDVYERNTVNRTTFEQTCRSFVFRTQQVRDGGGRHTDNTHTHTHIWILLKQETVSGSGISWAICKSAPRSRHHHSVFLQTGCPSCRPTNSVKALKAQCPVHRMK